MFAPVDPISLIGTGVTTTIRLFEVVYQLKSVGPQTSDLLHTIEHVNRNIKEAKRLRQQKAALLRPDESEYMDGIIEDTIATRLEVARLIEAVRVDQETKSSISLTHRALWVLRDNPDVINKHRRLILTHQSLTNVIACLYSKDAIVITPVQEIQSPPPPPYDPDMAAFFERRTSRKQRKSMSNLRDDGSGEAKDENDKADFSGMLRTSLGGGGKSASKSTTCLSQPAAPPPPPTVAPTPRNSTKANHNPLIQKPNPKSSSHMVEPVGFGLTEAALWAASDDDDDGDNDRDDTTDPFYINPLSHSHTNFPPYLDQPAAPHALQHLVFASATTASNTTTFLPSPRAPPAPLPSEPPSQSKIYYPPPRPPKIPLTTTPAVDTSVKPVMRTSKTTTVYERELGPREISNDRKSECSIATLDNDDDHGNATPTYPPQLPSPPPYNRKPKMSWLAYHATRSDAGHCPTGLVP